MKRVAVMLGGLLLAFPALAQQPMQGQGQQVPSAEQMQFIFFEPINLLAEDSTASRVDIPYRIDNDFFIALKNNDTSLPYPFKKRGEVLIELFDAKGVSKAREISRFEIGTTTSESRSDTKSWHQGMASFRVPPGEYTIVVEADDLESERKYLDRNNKVTARRFDGTSAASTPVFVQTGNGGTLTLLNFAGNLAFGADASIFLELHSKDLTTDPVRVEYSVSTQPFLFQDPATILADTIEQLALVEHSWPDVVKNKDIPPAYSLTTIETVPNTTAIIVPLSTGRLPLRPFQLEMTIKQGKTEWTVKKPFRMVWPEMPMSLRDIDFAIDALRHITRESELDSLQSGSRDVRLTHLEEFWKQKDRTPDTEYNEVMVEYYRRVDHALRTFSSMKGGDGHKTDRGRIYILHGPPSNIDRSLDPSAGFQELWMYEKQNKKFIFRDQTKSGNYVLVATQNL